MIKLILYFFGRKTEKNIYEILAYTAGSEGMWGPNSF